MVSFFLVLRPFVHSSFRASSPINRSYGFHGKNVLSIIKCIADDVPPVASACDLDSVR